MIKLYVLTKWSKGANHLQHIKNVIGLVHEQSYQTVDAREHLSETRGILPNARERNHDIVTAIDVLGHGEPQRLPASIVEGSMPQAPLSDNEARDVVYELDQAIRVRLACDEPLPLAFRARKYEVSDGRVRLAVPNLYDITLTLSGSEAEDRWYLLSVIFDFQITGAGKESFPTDLWPQQREGFIANANEILSPKPSSIDSEIVAEGEAEKAEPRLVDPHKSSAETKGAVRVMADAKMEGNHNAEPSIDKPLVRLYTFLQSQALEYQLDILAYQIAELSRLRWRGDLSWSWEGRTLTINYWTAMRRQVQEGHAKRQLEPLKGASVRLQIQTKAEGSACDALLDEIGQPPRLAEPHPHSSGHTDAEETRLELTMAWEADDRLKAMQQDSISTGQASHQRVIDAQHLDAEELLLEVTSMHCVRSLEILQRRILRSSLGRTLQDTQTREQEAISVHKTTDGAELTINLHETLRLSLSLDARTGRLSLRQSRAGDEHTASTIVASTLSRTKLESRLRGIADSLNDSTHGLIDVLTKLRVSAILSSLEKRASYWNLQSSRRLAFSQEEYSKFGIDASNLLFLPLQQCPSFYCVLAVQSDSISAALICAMPTIDGNGGTGNAMILHSLRWLDAGRIVKQRGRSRILKRRRRPSKSGEPQDDALHSLSIQDIGRIYSFAVALTISSQVESQLRMRNVSFTSLPPTKLSVGMSQFSAETLCRAQDEVPSIVARASDVFGGSAAKLLHKNVLIEVKEYWNPMRCHIQAAARMRFHLPKRSPDDGAAAAMNNDVVQYDANSDALIFRTQNLSQTLDVFAYAWQPIARVASLAHLLRPHNDRSAPLRDHSGCLLHFDLRSVRFAYGPREALTCSVSWDGGTLADPALGQIPILPGYRLSFGSRRNQEVKPIDRDDSSYQVLERNPHEHIRPALQAMLNAGTPAAIELAGGQQINLMPKWSAFLALLDDTRPLLSMLAPLLDKALDDPTTPDVEFLSAMRYRIIFAEKYRLEIRLIKGGKAAIHDSARQIGGLNEEFETKGDTAEPAIPDLRRHLQDAVHSGAEVADSETGDEASAIRGSLPALVLGNCLLCDLTAGRPSGSVVSRILEHLIDGVGRQVAADEGIL